MLGVHPLKLPAAEQQGVPDLSSGDGSQGPEYLRPPVLPVQKLTARLQKLGPAAQGSKAVSSRAVTLNLPSAVTL